MQTFLPYPEFHYSAQCLDFKRLGKQRVEAKQLVSAITLGTGWSNHPAARMWKSHPRLLCEYGRQMCAEWIRRGYNDSLMPWFVYGLFYLDPDPTPAPEWLGDWHFHSSHRSNLLRKDPEHYSQFEWPEPNNLPYIWPKN